MLCISKTDSYNSLRVRFPHLFVVSRNALAFLCLSVASVVFFAIPTVSHGATTTVSIAIQDISSTTSRYTVGTGVIPVSTACTYSFGYGTVIGQATGGSSGSCNTNDFLVGDNSVRVQPNFDNPVVVGLTYTGYIRTASTTYIINFFSWNGSKWDTFSAVPLSYSSGFNSVLNTRFTDLDITGTSTLNIDVDYFLDGDEIDTAVSAKNPTWVKFWYADRASTSTDFEKINEVISVVAGSSTISTNITGLADGTYDLLIGFSNFGCSVGLSDCPFPDSYVYSSFTVGGGVLTSTGTNEFYDKTSPIQDNTYQECGITNIGGCLVNAGLYLFVPDDASIQQISDSFEGLQTTFPFVYAFQANDYVDTLFSATSTDAGIVASTTLGTITFVNRAMLESVPYSDTFRTIIAYSMWLTFLWGAYRVVLKMFNPTTV